MKEIIELLNTLQYKKIDEKTHIQLTSNPSKKEVSKQQTSPDDSER